MSGAQLPRPGDMIAGKYVLDRLLGQGGMGAVFAARHLELSKAVAIKFMLADASNAEASQRFKNEARAAANIQSEHVVRVDDVGDEMGYAYMVLELLEGQDLAQLLEKDPVKRLPPHVAAGYVLQGCKGVMQAHAIGIVHRDLKPSNLFLAQRKDGTQVVKVLDFGISKAQGSSALAASPSALTSTKAMLGSPLYMSPEQLRNAKSVDHRADIWAMGVILYELITGHLPFMGENLGELFAAILESDPQPLSTRVSGIPMGLDDVVLRCLQRKPEQRYQSVAELAAALAPFEHAMPPMPMPSTNRGGGTAFLPGGIGASPQTIPSGAAQSSPGAQGISSAGPMTGPQLPQLPFGALTPNTPAGVALPAGFNQTTGSGWQTAGGTPQGVPKSKLPLILGAVFAGLAAVGVIGALVYMKTRDDHAKADVPPIASSVTVATEPPPHPSMEPTAPPPEPKPEPEPPPPPPSAIVSASAPPPPSAPPTIAVAPKPPPPPSPSPNVKPPAPPPSPAPAPAPPRAPSTPTPETRR
ncbi:MAG: serine/threonine protein kinase [Labilithrix sp.]|nr:serine/threonine protein kinase [Labilithrix sp.]MCW5817481.1 serine/threonine protein kinase [Labilithrix sp.]